MSIAVTCDVCRASYTLAEHLQGKRVRCRQCRATIRVPGLAGPARAGAASQADVYQLAEDGPEAPAAAAPAARHFTYRHDGASAGEVESTDAYELAGGQDSDDGYALAPVKTYVSAEPAAPPPGQRRVVHVMSATDAVDADQGIKGVRRYMRDLDSALEFYARRRQQTFTLGNMPRTCECCSQETREAACLTWHCHIYRTGLSKWSLATVFAGAVVQKEEWLDVEFQTFHRVCQRCFRKMESGNTTAALIGLGALAGTYLVFLLISCILFAAAMGAEFGGRFLAAAMIIPIVPAVIAWIIAHRLTEPLAVPQAFRRFGGGYFNLIKRQRV